MNTIEFNQMQQTFALNWLSNILAGVKETYADLGCDARLGVGNVLKDEKVIRMIGEWNLEWGPVVYSHAYDTNKPDKIIVADNTMFLVSTKSYPGLDKPDVYILSVAGTNPISPYGWFIEDFNTGSAVDWPFYPSDGGDLKPKISQGTYIGLMKLMHMNDESHGGSVMQRLTEIARSANPQTKLIVTGHSLGGALSASLALALFNMQTNTFPDPTKKTQVELNLSDGGWASNWDDSLNMILSSMPTAGATPGDLDFAMYYDQKLGSRTVRIWNRIDVVPHAWQKDMMIEVPHLYYPFVKPNDIVLALADLALGNSLRAGVTYRQIMEQTPGLNSAVNISLASENELTNIGKYLENEELAKLILTLLNKMEEKFPFKINEKINEEISQLLAKTIIARLEEDDAFSDLIKKLPGWLQHIFESLLTTLIPVLFFLIQLGFQHVNAYTQLMEIDSFGDVMKKYKSQFPLKCS